ncbi:MAG TPA: alpha/beta hydrolase [Chitinophagaceae bacterium]|nr:alpha/beta hydrolase [Chitinophagaceae bacterium]
MKRISLLLICALAFQYSIAQNAGVLYRKADSLYNLKDYSGAAATYTELIKRGSTDPAIYIKGASASAMANSPDSAFKLLDAVSQNNKLVGSDYNNLVAAKDLSALKSDKRWKAMEENFKKRVEANSFPQQELVYGRKDGMGLLMTQIKPKVKANGKTVIRVLAGSWFSSPAWVERSVYYTRRYLEKGYTVFMVAVGSQPRFAIPDEIEDLKRAVRYIRYNAKQLGVEPDKIGIEGGSAGGHLSLCIATADDKIDANAADPVDRVSSRVQAVAVLFPPTDFFNWGAPGVSVINLLDLQKANRVYGAFDFSSYNNTTSTYDRISDTAARNKIGKDISPINSISSDDPPIFIIHGDADPTVPLQQSQAFIARVKEVGLPYNFIIKKGGRHNEDDMMPEVFQFVDWFDKYLK